MPTYEYGVAYEFDEDGAPLPQFVECADDEQDARDWMRSSGDQLAKVVRRPRSVVFDPPWQVI